MKLTLRQPSILLTAVLGLSLIGLTTLPPSTAAGTHVSKVKFAAAKKAPVGRGASFIKVSREDAIKSPKGHQPPKKGGARSRGAWGVIDFDNYSGDYVDCYVDGTYVGTVAPYGDLYDDEPGGFYTLAAVDADDQGTYGPREIYLSGTFAWHLNG